MSDESKLIYVSISTTTTATTSLTLCDDLMRLANEEYFYLRRNLRVINLADSPSDFSLAPSLSCSAAYKAEAAEAVETTGLLIMVN